MTRQRFCLSDNLSFYLTQQGYPIKDWHVFLSMFVIGFKYSGIYEDVNGEILNGLSGTSDKMLRTMVELFGLEKLNVPMDTNIHESFIISVDDYHLPYNVNYQKANNVRFATISHQDQAAWFLYDSGPKHITCDQLKLASKESFVLEWSKRKLSILEIEDVLADRYLSNWVDSEVLKEYIQDTDKFITDLRCLHLDANTNKKLFDQLFFYINRPSGPTVTRFQFGEALLELSKNKQITITFASDFMSLGEQWEIIGNLFFKLSRRWSKELLSTVIERIERVIQRERELFECMHCSPGEA